MKSFVAIALISTLLHTVCALECYQCNSKTHGDLCKTAAPKFKQPCGTDEDGNEFQFCRKMDMYMDMDFGEFHPAEYRVLRMCALREEPGLEEDSGNCYYKSDQNTRSFVCHCEGDNCNPAAHVVPTLATLLPIAAAAAALRQLF